MMVRSVRRTPPAALIQDAGPGRRAQSRIALIVWHGARRLLAQQTAKPSLLISPKRLFGAALGATRQWPGRFRSAACGGSGSFL
jgi:hypothetical protein